MDASSLDVLFDPSKCSKLSMDQKRELVYEVSKWSDGAAEILHSWSRHEILQVLCAELGKERKYTGLTKSKIIEQLLKIVYEKRSHDRGTENVSEAQPPENTERTPKRQKQTTTSAPNVDSVDIVYCKNSACKAKMSRDDVFCKRCSCCICRQYDDNKDPSLWLICNSESQYRGICCGMSCHLECALRHENWGISKDRQDKGSLDGSFCCVSCGKVNDLLGPWRKQLVVARDTRRVDILCYRLSLAQKILAGTKLYRNLCGDIDEAVKKLEQEVGPLTGLPVKKARGIVNRLSLGPEIQRLCASTVESLDLMLSKRVSETPSDCTALVSKFVRIEDIRASSLTVILNYDDSNSNEKNFEGFLLWCRKADDMIYPSQPTCRLSATSTKFLLSDLTPATDYFLKVLILDKDRENDFCEIPFRTGNSEDEEAQNIERTESPATNCSSLSNPSSVEDETNNVVPCGNEDDENRGDDKNTNCSDNSQKETNNGDVISLLDEEQISGMPKSDIVDFRNKESSNGETSTGNGSNTPQTGLECVPYVNSLQITPYKSENGNNEAGKKIRRKISAKYIDIEEPQAGSSSKKRSGENRDKECNGIGDKDFEYYVKVIRWLECEGHIETTFRQKFLTWYSLRASSQEVRIVKAFIDTFIEDPESLAEQLVDTFSEVVSNKRCSTVPVGFCLKLWH